MIATPVGTFIKFPSIDPVILPIYGHLALRWYNLAYIIGFGVGLLYCRYLLRLSGNFITQKQLDDLLVWAVIGVFLGGRLGHVFFYEFSNYIANPLSIIKIWEGGMSFHGGVLGVIISFLIFHRVHKITLSKILDLAAAAVPIGIFFGRLANFINDELYGRLTDVPWAVLFPSGGYLPRHPSQVYEAILEGAILFLILFFCIKKKNALSYPGRISGFFLMGYGLSRFIIEFVREPDGWWYVLTTGQVLSIPMIAASIGLLIYSRQHTKSYSRSS